MTTVYFVRHCQSQKGWKESDAVRPLTAQGMEDSALVTKALEGTRLDYCVCSPYQRSIDTIKSAAAAHSLPVNTDVRLGERIAGSGSDDEALRRRWADHDYHEEGGESINEVQRRNIEGLFALLDNHDGENILFGTHGTALSVIINYYEPSFGYDDFMKLFGWMPYIIRAGFDGRKLIRREDFFICDRGY